MPTFKQYINEQSFTDNNEKINQVARRIWANVTSIANQYRQQQKDFTFFKNRAMGGSAGISGMHNMAIYGWLTQRMSGFEQPNQDNTRAIQQMTQQMANAPAPPQAQYEKGQGWHHWIINGDMGRSQLGTHKVFIPVHYKTLLPQAENVMSSILRNLVSNGYKGQIKIAASARDGWLDRMDNIVLHSGTTEWAQFGAKVVKATLDKFGVKTGGLATSGEMEQGLDPKGSGQSFNQFVASKASKVIYQILNSSNDYDQFLNGIKNYFSANGAFTQETIKMFSQST
ncbi:MAG: hypothetical protein EBU90_26410 [Proteobacteria bacterium]|nr:hypothetical protein [Pseudomonadota bacterium]